MTLNGIRNIHRRFLLRILPSPTYILFYFIYIYIRIRKKFFNLHLSHSSREEEEGKKENPLGA